MHGYAHELTCSGAARMGSQRESTMVAIAEGSAVKGQSVPRSPRTSCCVAVPSTMVETSSRSRASIQSEVEGPAGPRELVPRAVGMSMYTEGDVKVYAKSVSTYVEGYVYGLSVGQKNRFTVPTEMLQVVGHGSAVYDVVMVVGTVAVVVWVLVTVFESVSVTDTVYWTVVGTVSVVV